MTYYVWGLKTPGTRQELKLREGGVSQWLQLALLQRLRFTGPVRDSYRPAEIYLTSGERIQAEVFVDHLIEGTTFLGYWNVPLAKVESLQMGK